jgi:G:T-mismatch repair DNA endonuclease (very short patch repair protein)
MSVLGEIRTAKELNRKSGSRYIYSACVDCSKERWSILRHGKADHIRCNVCSNQTEEKRTIMSRKKKGCVSPFKGKKHTTESNTKNSFWHKNHIHTDEHKLRTSKSVKEYCRLHPELWDKLHKTNTGRKRTPEQVERISRGLKGKHHTEEQKLKTSEVMKAYCTLHPEIMVKLHKSTTGRKHTPEQVERIVRGIIKASHMRPNKCEIRLGELISSVSHDFGYNGGGELGVVLGGRIPDFVNTNGKKQVINFNGCHWHDCQICHPLKYTENNTRNNIQPYIDLGYKVLVIWEHELLNEKDVVEKISDFTGKEVAVC